MITELTPEQEAKIEVYRDKWLDKFFKYELAKTKTDEEMIKAGKLLYKFCELEEPTVLVANSPYHAQQLANEFLGNKTHEYIQFSNYINYSDFGWLSFYDYFANEFDIIDENLKKDLAETINFVENSFMSIQLEKLLVVSRYPEFISRNSENDLHNTKVAAVSFRDGYEQHYVNGRFIEKDIFEDCQTIEGARKRFKGENNSDIKAAIISIIKENLGNQGVLDMLDALVVDTKVIEHANDYKETVKLLKTRENFEFAQNSKGETNQPLAWVEMVCPSTGSTYLIEVCPLFNDAIEAMKWLRPNDIPMELEYFWVSAN